MGLGRLVSLLHPVSVLDRRQGERYSGPVEQGSFGGYGPKHTDTGIARLCGWPKRCPGEGQQQAPTSP